MLMINAMSEITMSIGMNAKSLRSVYFNIIKNYSPFVGIKFF
jgi:hypothetical protein